MGKVKELHLLKEESLQKAAKGIELFSNTPLHIKEKMIDIIYQGMEIYGELFHKKMSLVISGELIKFPTSKLLKEIGFDLEYTRYFTNSGLQFSVAVEDSINMLKFKGYYPAPTQTSLHKWLRDKYHLHVNVCELGLNMWSNMIIQLELDGTTTKEGDLGKKNYESFEEALEAGLYQILLIIKNNSQN